MPLRLGFSTHVAARFFHGAQKAKPDVAAALAEDLLAACFADGRDIAALETLQDVAVRHGFDADRTAALAADPANRAMLAECVDEALAAGVIGSPFMILDGEGFFGADRLPQLAWRLGQG